ncbi:MAG: MBL fold metallo-hydrolase [Cyanobacteria bacterium P01_A01_bin.83]
MPQNSTEITASPGNTRTPRTIMPGIFAFTPNRDTLGGTSYLIVDNIGNILLDCPAWNEVNQEFIQSQGGINYLIISHRGGIGKNVWQMQQALNCQVIVQEQEAYLLPENEVTTFADTFSLSPELELIWTPGHSPGSSCLYWQQQGGVLFTGRHLLPKSKTQVLPLRTAKTFHWWRQLNSIAKLRARFSLDTLQYILPGANTGYLRGTGYIANAYQQLQDLDLTSLKNIEYD